MARGESPFQGRYTVPIADFSGIERGGAAWGEAFKGIGESIGGAIEKYGLNKQERLTTEAEIEGILANNPEMAEKIQTHPDMGPLFKKQVDGKANLSDTRQLYSFLKSNTAEQDRRVRSELLGYQRDEAVRRTEAAEVAAQFASGKREELKTLMADKSKWLKHPEITEEKWLENLTQPQRRLIFNRELIEAGEYTPQSELEALQKRYSLDDIRGKLGMLPAVQKFQEETIRRAAKKLDKGPTVEEEIELTQAQHAAQLATAEGVPGQLETAADVAKEQLARAQYMNSAEVRDMDSAAQKVALANNLSLIKARNMTTEATRQKLYAAMNPSDSKLLEANDQELKAAFTRIVKWEDDDGKAHRGPYEDWLEKFSQDEDLIPSRGIIDNEDRIKGLLFQQEQIGGRNMVWADDSPAQQAQQGAVDMEKLTPAAEDEAANVYLENLGTRPLQPQDNFPPIQDSETGGAFDPAMREEIINRARAQGISEDAIRVILGE